MPLQHSPVCLCSSSTSAVGRLFEGDAQELPKGRLQEAVTAYALCDLNFMSRKAKLLVTDHQLLHCLHVKLCCFVSLPVQSCAHSNMHKASSNLINLQCCGKVIQATHQATHLANDWQQLCSPRHPLTVGTACFTMCGQHTWHSTTSNAGA